MDAIAVGPAEAAALIGISKAQLYRIIARGDLAAVKIGHRTVIRVADLRAFIDAQLAATSMVG